MDYSEGYSLVTREDLDSFYYYQPALQRISIVDVKDCPGILSVAYIMGAGDDIPTVLQANRNEGTTLIPRGQTGERRPEAGIRQSFLNSRLRYAKGSRGQQ